MSKNNKEASREIYTKLFYIIATLVAATGVVFIARYASDSFSCIDQYNASLIISFIGVLATFIVVGNYAQTSEIKHEIKEVVDTLTDEQSDSSHISRLLKIESILNIKGDTNDLKELKDKMEKTTEASLTQMINDSISEVIELQSKTQSLSYEVMQVFQSLIESPYQSILSAYIKDPSTKFKAIALIDGNSQERPIRIYVSDTGEVQFLPAIKTGKKPYTIQTIEGCIVDEKFQNMLRTIYTCRTINRRKSENISFNNIIDNIEITNLTSSSGHCAIVFYTEYTIA